MKSKILHRSISVLLCLLIAIGLTTVSLTANAAALPDGYENDYENISYQDLGILEDQYDLIEPVNNLFPIISPSSKQDTHLLYKGSYKQVEDYLKNNGMTDGMSIVPPTKLKAEKFLGYSSYGFDQPVATVDGRTVKAYMVAANAIMAGCAPEHTPFCIAFTEALSNSDYLASLSSGNLTPMMYINGPAAHQIGIDHTQGMTTEEANIAIGRFMELALINFTDIERDNAFGYVQPLVFSEDDETCLNIGWTPHHVEKGFSLNDNVITATSFAMWGNNVTPATDLPDEIMKVLAWDITEKNLGGLGSASIEDNANAKRLIFITESVATALATKYKSKDALESALVENARRPLWMRAYAYYYANTGGALSKSFSTVYNELKAASSEDAKVTASPAWMNGITYSEIDTVAAMKKGNTNIIVTGDSSRNKTQVMPGGISVEKEVQLSNRWDDLVTSVNYFPLSDFYLSEQDHSITPPASVPSVLTNGTYRILDPASGAQYLTRAGRVYYDAETSTLHYYAQGASSKSSITLNPDTDAAFITYLNSLGYNSSFTVRNGQFTEAVIRFSSNASKLNNNIVALTNESFNGMSLTLHANNTQNSNAAGGLAKDGATVEFSDTVTSYTVNLDGTIQMGERTNNAFVTLSGSTVTVNPTVEAGATAIIGAANTNGTYRTMTFTNGGDGTYKVTYNTAGTLSNRSSSVYLKGTFNNWSDSDAFAKTANSDVVSATKELGAGTYEFKIHKAGADEWYSKGETITDTTYRLALNKSTDTANCTLTATGGTYEFKYELSTNKLSVYRADNNAAQEEETETPVPTQAPTSAPVTEPATKTITVGVISYVINELGATGYQVHYWGGSAVGDVNLTATGTTKQKSVGSAYWNNAPQTFTMYTAAIPADATGFKIHKGDRWFGDDGNALTQNTAYTFNYSGDKALYEYVEPVAPTSAPTQAPTTAPTAAPTHAPTAAPTQAPTQPAVSNGYYLVGSMNDWSLSADYQMTRVSSQNPREYRIEGIDLTTTSQFKIAYTSVTKWIPSGADNNYGAHGEITADGTYTIFCRPNEEGDDSWYNKMILAQLTQAAPEPPTEAPTQAPTQASTEAPTASPTQAPTEEPAQQIVIVSQPTNWTGNDGDPISISVIAEGKDLAYQWFYLTKGKTSWVKAEDTDNTYDGINMRSDRNNRLVYCMITDSAGNSVKTDTVKISYPEYTAPVITAQPVSWTGENGETATFTVSAQGDNLTYLWFYRNKGKVNWVNTNITTASYSIEMSSLRNGREVYCLITDSAGNSVNTDVVTMSYPELTGPVIVAQPKDWQGSDGEQVHISVTAAGTNLTYQWFYRPAGKTNWIATDDKDNCYDSVEMSSVRNGREIFCMIKDGSGNITNSNVVTMSYPKATGPVIVTQPSDWTGKSGQQVNVRVVAQGDGLTYQWFYRPAGKTNWIATDDKDNAYDSVEMNQSRNGRQVYCKITDSSGYSIDTDVVTLHMAN